MGTKVLSEKSEKGLLLRFSLKGVEKNVILYTEDYAIQRFVISRFHYINMFLFGAKLKVKSSILPAVESTSQSKFATPWTTSLTEVELPSL